jgi:YbgC/YbaW family acyl-CoA thioester hydrolase
VPSVTVRHRVAMTDVDLVQANFAAYFRWMDVGFHELLAALGQPLAGILASGQGTPAVDAQCSYLSPVGLDDVIEITTEVAEAGRTSFTVEHAMAVGETPVAIGRIKHVWIALEPAKHAAPLPGWLRDAAR